jgi:uncharacterized protein YndB with AHSA1/START domain
MSQIDKSLHLNVPAERVWELIGSFNALPDWHPAIESSTLEDGGTLRRLKIAGGGEMTERLTQLDEDGHSYRYEIVDSPLPLSNYSSEMKVIPDADGKGCTIEWECEFKPMGPKGDNAEKILQGFYDAGLSNLKTMFGMK